MEFGAFVEIIPGVLGNPGKDGMVHISQLSNKRIEKVEDYLKLGDRVPIRVLSLDRRDRKISLERTDI